MKEIDFLPDCYVTGNRKRLSSRTAYVVIGCVFAVMVTWSFVTGTMVTKAKAQIESIEQDTLKDADIMQDYSKLQSQLRQLENQVKTLTQLDANLNFAGVLAELSFVIPDEVVLSRIDIAAEKFKGIDGQGKSGAATIRAVRAAMSKANSLGSGPVRFKLTLTGIAAEPSDVARLIRALEDSPYFVEVVPSYSRNKDIQGWLSSEFKIVCYLGNYRLEYSS